MSRTKARGIHPYLKETGYSGTPEYEDTRHLFGLLRYALSKVQTTHFPARVRDERLVHHVKNISHNLLRFADYMIDVPTEIFTRMREQLRNALDSLESVIYEDGIITIPNVEYPYIDHFAGQCTLLSNMLLKPHRRVYFETQGLYFLYGKGIWLSMNTYHLLTPKQLQGLTYQIKGIYDQLLEKT